MVKKPGKQLRPTRDREESKERHRQFPQESWSEIDAEGSDSEMSQGRTASDPSYTPLVTEAAERLEREREHPRPQEEKGGGS